MNTAGAITGIALPDAASVDVEVHASLEVIDELYNYNHWIFRQVRPFIRGSVCEVGCGTGVITQFLVNQSRVMGIEPYPPSLRKIRERFAQHKNLSFTSHSLQECPNNDVERASFDTVICLNVLEHIKDDVGALRRMRDLCKTGGRVVILVPAHMSAYGHMDRSFGHFRRYNRRGLRRAFGEAGLKMTDGFYMNAIGYFGWILQGRLMKRKRISVSTARNFNRMVVLLEALEHIIHPPFGQSLVMTGTPAGKAC